MIVMESMEVQSFRVYDCGDFRYGIDDNDNGLVDENLSHVPVGSQLGVSYSDRIDNNNNGEQGSPLVTEG